MHIPILIDKKQYFIGSDGNQYMIGPERTAKDGTKIVDGRWFYQSLGALFTSLLHKKVRASDAKSLEELRNVIYRAEAELMAAFNFDKLGDSMVDKVSIKMGGISRC